MTNLNGSARTEIDLIASIIEAWVVSYVRLDHRTGEFYLYDPDLRGRAGYTTHMMVASFLKVDRHPTSYVGGLSLNLALAANSIQNMSGGIEQPYNVKIGSLPLVDIVEFGAVAGNVAFLAEHTGSPILREGLIRGANYVLEQRAVESKGGFYKNTNSVEFDVLNASAYACNAFVHAYLATADLTYYNAAKDAMGHLISNFSSIQSGWWVYSQTWDGKMVLGPSVSYQASIIALIGEVIQVFSEDIRSQWESVRVEAMSMIVQALLSDRPDEYETPAWSRNWANVSEIDWALAGCLDLSGVKMLQSQRLAALLRELESGKKNWSAPDITAGAKATSPITGRFRKIANLAGSLFRIQQLE